MGRSLSIPEGSLRGCPPWSISSNKELTRSISSDQQVVKEQEFHNGTHVGVDPERVVGFSEDLGDVGYASRWRASLTGMGRGNGAIADRRSGSTVLPD